MMMTTRTVLKAVLFAGVVFCAHADPFLRILENPWGPMGSGQFGMSVAGGGDWDADGYPDLVVGSPKYVPPQYGSVSVFSGRTGKSMDSWVSSVGINYGKGFGASVAHAGDLDGDGLGDVIVGSLTAISAFNGDGFLWMQTRPDPGVLIPVVVASLGDVDGDGRPDVAMGDSQFDGSAGALAGRVAVYSGATGAFIRNIEGETPYSYLGTSVCGAGDVNGDGVPDIAAGGAGYQQNVGRTYLFSGASGSLLRAYDAAPGDMDMGRAVANAGDATGDGIPDLLVSSMQTNSYPIGRGRVSLFSGADGTRVWSQVGPQVADLFGSSIAATGDVNGDGKGDFLVGAPQLQPQPDKKGKAYLYSGAPGRALLREETGQQFQDGFGTSVCGAGDLDGNGRAEVAIGAPFFSGSAGGGGRVYVGGE